MTIVGPYLGALALVLLVVYGLYLVAPALRHLVTSASECEGMYRVTLLSERKQH